MPIDETLNVTASYTTPRGTNISRQSETLTIKDTSHNVVVITINKHWRTTAESSYYGGLYIKPTLNIYDEIMARGGFVSGKKYLFVVESDVVLVADNVNVGGIYGDSRVPYGYDISVDLWGLALGRGGYGADFSAQDNQVNRKVINGFAGGPAVTSVQDLWINVWGGLAGGGGGGGNSGYYWNDDSYYKTSIKEWWYVGPKFPIDSGAGAPFGLRSEPNITFGSLEILTHQNKEFMFDFDDVPGNIVNYLNNDNMLANRWIGINASPKEAYLWGYTNRNLDRVININRYFTHPTRWFIDNQAAAIAANWYNAYDYMRKYDEDTAIGVPKVWLMDSGLYRPSQGGRVPAVGYAGLFRGASAASIGRNQVSYSNWTSSFLCSSQAFIDARKNNIRGSRGGDLGKPGEDGPMPMAITSHVGTLGGGNAGFESMDGIQGRNHYRNTANTNTVIQVGGGSGGWNGNNFAGRVSINQQSGGALGGDEVLNKYDPAGNFDWNARGGSNYGKTFKGVYYLRG